MQVRYSNKAMKALKKLDPDVRRRIIAKINAYAADPFARAQNVRALRGTCGYRLRVGEYRVLFEVTGESGAVMWVYKLGHRKDVTDGGGHDHAHTGRIRCVDRAA